MNKEILKHLTTPRDQYESPAAARQALTDACAHNSEAATLAAEYNAIMAGIGQKKQYQNTEEDLAIFRRSNQIADVLLIGEDAGKF